MPNRLALVLVALLARQAAAAPPPPSMPSAKTPPGRAAVKALHNVDYLMGRPVCISNETSIPQKLALAAQYVAQIPDPGEKQAFEAWLAAADAFWQQESKGPAASSWDEIGKRSHAFAERERLLARHPSSSDADLDALFAEVTDLIATAARDHALAETVPSSPCGKATAGAWAQMTAPDKVREELHRTLQGVLKPIADPVLGFAQRKASLDKRAVPQTLLDVGAMIDEVRAILDELPAAKRAGHRAERWASAMDAPGETWWAQAGHRMDALEADLGPTLARLLEPVAISAEVTPARTADARRLVKDKVLALRVTSPKRDEDHEVPVGAVIKYQGKVYLVKAAYREVFESYEVRWVTTVLPERWAAIPGFKPGELCAIRGGFLRRYKQGHDVKLGVWSIEEEADLAPMLCKNATQVSTLR